MANNSWNSAEEVGQSVETIVSIMKRKRMLPVALVDSYKSALDSSDLEFTRKFYEQLTIRCPEALDYFMD
jgi:hypothetical protein